MRTVLEAPTSPYAYGPPFLMRTVPRNYGKYYSIYIYILYMHLIYIYIYIYTIYASYIYIYIYMYCMMIFDDHII